MPKATLEFNLPEEQEEYDITMRAGNFSHSLWEFDQEFLRANIKYGIQEATVDAVMAELTGFLQEDGKDVSRKVVAVIAEAALEVARTQLYEIMNENNGNPFT